MSAPVRRFAVSRLHLPDGRVLKNEVIEVTPSADGPRFRHYPLVGEQAFTEWLGGDYDWPPSVPADAEP